MRTRSTPGNYGFDQGHEVYVSRFFRSLKPKPSETVVDGAWWRAARAFCSPWL